MTRGRQSNTAHVVTGNTAPPGHKPYQQATPEAVLASILQRDDGDLSATEQIRQAQDWAGGTGHLLTLWSVAIRQTLHPDNDQQIKARLTEAEAWRYDREHSRQALHQRLRAAQLAGHDMSTLVDRITAAPMDRARSVSSVLYGRLQRLAVPNLRHDVTWVQRTPATAPAIAHELAAALDDRARALGERLAASPEPWLARHLGVLAPGASPALREEYTRRAGIAAAYREAAGITNPEQALSIEPHRGNPELEAMRRAVFTALEIRDEADIIRSLDATNSKHELSKLSAPAPPPHRTSAGNSGSPRKPKPTPTGNLPTPKPSTTAPPRPAPQPWPHSWLPNASASKPTTPGTSNGPPTPTPPGTQPGNPQPNCNDEGTPSQTANHIRNRKTNSSR
jgi:hypothetical protein